MLGIFKKKKEQQIHLSSPFKGRLIDITKVDDPAFSEKMLGEGIGVLPEEKVAKAPCDGEIIQIFPTNHAYALRTSQGVEVLVHIGIGTVQLKGAGFKRLVEVGNQVKKGDPIIEADFAFIKEQGKDITTIVVITNSSEMKSIEVNTNNLEEMLVISV